MQHAATDTLPPRQGMLTSIMSALGLGSRGEIEKPADDVTPGTQLVDGAVEPPAPLDLLHQAQALSARLPAQVVDAVDAALAYATFEWAKPSRVEAQELSNAYSGQLTPMGSPSAAARVLAGELEMA